MFMKVGVIGAGTMGSGVAMDLILHGINVILFDISFDILEKAKAQISKEIRYAPILKKDVPRLTQDKVSEMLILSCNLEDTAECDFIIENVTEKWSVKKQVYCNIENLHSEGIFIGANTSCISITKIASLVSFPEKVIGMHFMNPVFLKSTIEVIKGFNTSEECIEKAKLLLGAMGKSAIIVNDLPGFVANRISHLMMNEAAFIVQDQVASPSQVDEIFIKCYGHEMGPLATADLIGLDTVVNSLDELYESYQDSKFRCCPLLRKMVHAGILGRKSGKGFFEYSNT